MIKTHLPLQECKDSLEKALDRLLTPPEGPYSYIFHAARYSLLTPGKRLRPLLVIATGETFGVSLEKTLNPACALEMIHTYSLIHDDLPCMDDDDLRRGKPTLHTVYPEGQAVLAGDLLLTLCFQTLASSPNLTAKQMVDMISVLSKHAGGTGMIGGQSLDLFSEDKAISWETLKAIHMGKTAALLSASLEIGGIAAGVCTSILKELCLIGQKIGLSFQIIDDILDVEGDQTTLGKPLGSDLENHKTTSISLLGLDAAKKLSEELLQSVLEQCKNMQIEQSPLAQMLPKLVHRSF